MIDIPERVSREADLEADPDSVEEYLAPFQNLLPFELSAKLIVAAQEGMIRSAARKTVLDLAGFSADLAIPFGQAATGLLTALRQCRRPFTLTFSSALWVLELKTRFGFAQKPLRLTHKEVDVVLAYAILSTVWLERPHRNTS